MISSKKASFIIILIICLILTSCSSFNNSANKTINQNSTVKNSSKIDASNEEEISVKEQVLLNQDDFIVTLKSIELGGIFGPELKVLVENNSHKTVTIQTRDSAVNGVMVQTLFSSEIVSNKKANDEITISKSDLEQAGITKIKDIEFKFHIFDSEEWDGILDSDIIKINTTVDEAYQQKYDDSGTIVLDEKGFKIIMKKVSSEDSFWGADVYMYIENNSDFDATIQARDVSINGFMVNPIFSSEVLAGKKAYDSITFLESDLEDNDIKYITDLELSFHIFETNKMDVIFDSPLTSITFE